MRHMRFVGTVLAALAVTTVSHAKPTGPMLFCQAFPESPLCAGKSVTCSLCHVSTTPDNPSWNSFGVSLFLALVGSTFEEGLSTALASVGATDHDQDGISTAEEIAYGSLPGDPASFEKVPWVPLGQPNPRYNINAHDPAFAYRRVAVAFCGRSPTYAEMSTLSAAADKNQALHDKLQSCLESGYWRDRMLPRLADPKIRPIDRFFMWTWDYQLFRYVLTGDRDARDLILADYHVVPTAQGGLTKIEGTIPAYGSTTCVTSDDCEVWEKCGAPPNENQKYCNPADGGQPLDPSLRAGMITTNWFHFYNTMFSALPRQTASQAYRAYADLDIARQQGLYPNTSYEALDVDGKGILQPECYQCHATLERLAYPFAAHYGIGGGPTSDYNEQRPVSLGLWDDPQSAPIGVVFGVEVSTIREWAQVVAASDQFRLMLTKMIWDHAIGREPGLADNAEFTNLWKSLPALDFNVEKLIHALADTDAFGAP